MKKIMMFFMSLVLLLSFTACGAEHNLDVPGTKATGENTEDKSDNGDLTKTSDANDLLEAYYKDHFDPDFSGYVLRDLNGDGQAEMLAFERVAATNGSVKKTALYYMTLKDKNVIVSDVLTQNYNNDYIGTDNIYDETTYGDYRGEAQEVFISDSDYICVCSFRSFMAWEVEYDVYKLQNGKFTWIKGVTDPGYTGGVGLYLDKENGSDYDYENGKLYGFDDGEVDTDGKYTSYEQAINSELSEYGFTFYENKKDGKGGSGKYHIKETESIKKIYGFSIYATLEDF
ncbi:MAG: hypothetical protein K5756_03160 [Clostridiales bacterium]|nr:hypothetical protein [Clostridiales bacterium]